MLKCWLEQLQRLREHYGIHPHDIYNMDEKGFVLGKLDRAKVIVRASKRTMDRLRRQPGNRDFVTVVETVGVSGRMLTPLVIFKAKQPPYDVCESMPKKLGKYHTYLPS